MITGPAATFVALCKSRGYTLEAVQPCIISSDGHLVTVDETHASYPHKRPVAASAPPPPQAGPGTELKKLLRLIGIKATPTCPCNARARQMDVWGPDECEKRLDEIVAWLEEEAGKRRLPFVRAVAATVVKSAIRKARKAAGRDINR